MKQTFFNSKLIKTSLAIGVGILVVGLLFQNCSQVKFQEAPIAASASTGAISTGAPVAPGPVVIGEPTGGLVDPAPPGYICSAFDNQHTVVQNAGLKAELRYLDNKTALTNDQRRDILATEYFNENDSRFLKIKETIFLSEINVPARHFDKGFTNAKGQLLVDRQGEVLHEFFALKIESELKLGDGDLPGYYELATISDDGTVVEIFENNQWQKIISNDGDHEPKMGCGSKKVYLDSSKRIPIRMYYNQGQRQVIANVFYKNYRGSQLTAPANYPSESTVKALCGVKSYWGFWNPETSEPKELIEQVRAAGWKRIAPDNYQLPNNQTNPCATR